MTNKLINLLHPPEFNRTAWTELHIAILGSTLVSIFMNIPIALVATISFADTLEASLRYSWFGIISTISLLRMAIIPYYKQRIIVDRQNIYQWVIINRIGLVLTGALWGSTVYLHNYPITIYQEVLIGFVILGLAGGSAAANAASTLNLLFYFIPLIWPIIFWYASHENSTLNSIALLMVFYFFYLLAISRRSQRIFLMNTDLRIKNESMASEFQYINEDLKKQIERRKHIESELITAKEDAENANKAKSEFLSSMSHELRTPLNAVIGFSEMLIEDSASEEQHRFLNNIHSAGKHLHGLIDQILDLARIEAGRIELKQEYFDINQLINECISLIIQPAQSRGITIDYSGSSIKFQNDRMRTKQVLLNLLSNAVKYNKDNGSIRVMLINEDTHIDVYVIDTGVGIAEEKLAALFMPFNRLDHEFSEIEGSGLGLAITKNLVELMGGNLQVESKEGVGSTFILRLMI
jgi:signal transduction histidine kinase